MNRGAYRVAWVAVQGVEAASIIWSALARWGPPMIPDPAYLGDRWWLLAAESALPLNAEILEAVQDGDRVLVLTQENAESWSVLLCADGVTTVVAVDPSGPIPADVLQFGRLGPGPQAGPRRIRSPTKGLPLKDPGAAWLKRAGWRPESRLDATRFLQGAQGGDPSGAADFSHLVAERHISAALTRWVVDRLDAVEAGYALWDRDQPGQPPLMHWPFTVEGRAAATAEFHRRVIAPILEACMLDGQRFWAPAPRLNTEHTLCGAVIAHWHPRGTITTIEPWPVPLTRLISPVGWAPLSPFFAARFDPDASYGVPKVSFTQPDPEVILDGPQVALRYAWAASSAADPGPWQEIPPEVPRSLEETCRWVRAQAAFGDIDRTATGDAADRPCASAPGTWDSPAEEG